MDYDPQTMSEQDMNKRLELFQKEFFTLAKSMDIISTRTEWVLQLLNYRLGEATARIDNDTKLRPTDT